MELKFPEIFSIIVDINLYLLRYLLSADVEFNCYIIFEQKFK